MVGIVLVTHCRVADEMLKVAKIIVGDIPYCVAVSIEPEEGIDVIGKKLESAIQTTDQGHGVLVLTDLFGGTPSNVSLSFLQEKKVEVLSGVNLPALLKICTNRADKNLGEVARMAKAGGKKNITLASEVMKKKI